MTLESFIIDWNDNLGGKVTPEIIEIMKAELEQIRPKRLIVNPSDAINIRDKASSRYVRTRTENLQPSFEVIESNWVESGKAYLITTSSKPTYARYIETANGLAQDFSNAFESARRSLYDFGYGLNQLFNPFGATIERYEWRRQFNESVWEWGNRLGKRGLLDDPDIRWEYQKAIMSLPIVWAKRLWSKR